MRMSLKSMVPEKGSLHCDVCGEPYGHPKTVLEESLIREMHRLFMKKVSDEGDRIKAYNSGKPEDDEVPDAMTPAGQKLVKLIVGESDRVFSQYVQMDVNGRRDGSVCVRVTVRRPDVASFSLRMANKWHTTLNKHCHWVAMDVVTTFREILRSNRVSGTVDLVDECPLPPEIQAVLDEDSEIVIRKIRGEADRA